MVYQKSLLKTFTIIIALAFLSSLVYSQKASFPGYYITTNGDTVSGHFTSYTQWQNSPGKVSFVTNASVAQTLTPSTCRSFYIQGYDTYISYQGTRLANTADAAKAMQEPNIDNSNVYDTVSAFLRLIVRTDSCAFYLLKDKKRENVFYQLPQQPMRELLYKVYVQDAKLREVAIYKSQLDSIYHNQFAEKNMMQQLSVLPYSAEDIRRFLSPLSRRNEPAKDKEHTKSRFMVTLGASANSYTVKGDQTIDEVKTKYSSSISPLAGAGVFVYLDRSFARYFFYPHISMYNYKASGTLQTISDDVTTTFKSSFIINTMLSAGCNIINSKPVVWYVAPGAGFAYLVDNKKLRAGRYLHSEQKEASFVFSYHLQTGVTFHHLSVWAGCIFPISTTNRIYYSGKLSSAQAGIGYLF